MYKSTLYSSLFAIIFGLCLFSCGEDKPEQAANSPVWPKYAKNQVVYILGEKPAMITDTPSIENNMYKYQLVTISADGERYTANWFEYELTKYPTNSTVSTIHHDTINTEYIVHTNTLTDQQQWVDAEFKEYTIDYTRIMQEARVYQGQADAIYTPTEVITRLIELDSILHSNLKNLSIDLKAGKYPKN